MEVISRVAPMIAKRAEELGMDVNGFSLAIRSTYEYARRLLHGKSIPSEGKVLDIISGLAFSDEEAELLTRLADEDRALHDRRRRENRSEKYPNFRPPGKGRESGSTD